HVAGIHDVDAVIALTAQVSSLSNILKSMNMAAGVTVHQSAAISYVYYGERHSFDNCPSNHAS
ncbi:hypothetical protein PanWU01x14_272480, partial [Parasponia andersonii]